MIALLFYFIESYLLKHIFNTASLKIVAMAMNFVVLFLVTNYLLTDGKGETAVFMANMAFVILVNGLVGSSVIIYLTPKTNFYNLLIPSYLWAAISSIGTPILFSLFMPGVVDWFSSYAGLEIESSIWGFEFIKSPYYLLLILCSFLGSAFEYNYMVLIGKERISLAQILNVSRNVILALVLWYVFVVEEIHDVYAYFLALFFSYALGFIASLITIFTLPEKFTLKNFAQTLRSLIKLGFIDQSSNILQFLNKRLPLYYLTYILLDKDAAGIFSTVATITEATLFLPQAVSVVQYSKISNSTDTSFNVSISEKMFRFNLVLLVAGLSILSFLPSKLFVFLFSEGFKPVGELIPYMAVGLVFFGSTSIFNHFFSGTGKFEENVYSNLLGLIATIMVGCFWLIPTYGLVGATLTPSVSYLVISVYLILSFLKKTDSTLSKLIPKKEDFTEFKELVFSRFKKTTS